MIYSDACEAQGMTLADLLAKKGEEEKTTWKRSELKSTLQLLDGTKYLYFVNNGTDDLAVTIYGSDGTLKLTTVWVVKSTLELLIQDSYAYIMFGSTKVTLERIDGYYTNFGLNKVVIDADKCPLVSAMWSDIVTRVNEKYWHRFLGAETLEDWQVDLQVLTDRIIKRYEHAFKLYTTNADEIDSDIAMEMVTEYLDVKDTATGSSYGKVSDTPDQSINESDSYAGQTSKGTTSNTNTKTGKVKTTQNGSDGILGHINANIDLWRDLETELVDEYRRAFMSFIYA